MPGTGTALEVHVRGVDKVNEFKTRIDSCFHNWVN